MYEHQLKAVDKLSKVKVGALYMEQGTGKTRTTLELINKRLAVKKAEHILWLCPCSVKENLKRDIIKHIGELDEELITICGIETLSSSIKANLELLELVENKNVYLIVDESNLVKNPNTKRTKNIIRLAEKCKYKLILNGTPISRNEADLFAQWYIVDWRILGYKSYWSFAHNHIEYDERIPGKIMRTLNTRYLIEKIALYSYQIKKSECLDLPDKTYEMEYYDLTDKQTKHYDSVANDLLFYVDELEPHTIYRMFTGLQNVISGFNVNVEKEEYEVESLDIYGEIKQSKHRVKSMTKTPFFKNPLHNPRIEKLLQIIDSIVDNKIIIFCKFTSEINDIVSILNRKYGDNVAVPFNGEVTQKMRQNNLDMFIGDARFLVANKQCGAYGLNLQFCSYIIYYSNDWDYATRAQSEDRIHRIGQTANVHIIDICASYTLDERIIKCLNNKENLVDSFKNELEKTKDKKELFAWIQKRDSRGKKYSKKLNKERCEELEDA